MTECLHSDSNVYHQMHSKAILLDSVMLSVCLSLSIDVTSFLIGDLDLRTSLNLTWWGVFFTCLLTPLALCLTTCTVFKE